jgi:hypothetical protein
MAAAVWTACTKLLCKKKMWSPEESDLFGVLLFYGRFFEGVLKERVFLGGFGGEVGAICVVNRGELTVDFRGLKIRHFSLNISVEKVNNLSSEIILWQSGV